MARARHLGAVPDRPGRVALYIRVSAVMGRSQDELHSPEMQERAMRQMVAASGLREVATIPDIDQTGRTFSREGLDQIRAMVEAGTVDVVAVYDLSRLGRNTAEALTFVRWLREHGVTIISTREQIDDTPEGQYMLTQFLGMAQLYSDQLGRRWQEVINFRAVEGKAHGTPPIGYLREPIPGMPPRKNGRRPTRVVVHTLLGPVMTDGFRDYAAGRLRISELADRLAVGGRRPDLTSVRRALGNPFYLGKVPLWGLPKGRRHPRVGDKPAAVFDGEHPALTDQKTFDAVQRRLRREQKTPERRHLAMGWSLVGLAVCAHCEMPLHMHDAKIGRSEEKVARLRCGSNERKKRTGCPGTGTPYLQDVEDAVLERVVRWASRLRADPAAATRRQAHAVTVESHREGLRRELAANRAEQAKLVERWLAGKIPDGAYEANLERLTTAEAALVERQDEVAETREMPTPGELSALVDKLVELWPRAKPPVKRHMLGSIVRRVLVRRPNYWREPTRDRVAVESHWGPV